MDKEVTDIKSVYAWQKKKGFPLLRFVPNLEVEFRRWYKIQNLTRVRVALLGSVLVYVMFSVLDVLTLPAEVLKWSLPIRLGIICPVLLLVLWCSQEKYYQTYLTPMLLLSVLATGWGVVAVVIIAHGRGIPLPYEGVILVTTYPYFFAGLLFPYALSSALSIFLLYVVLEYTLGMPLMQLTYNTAFLFTMNLIGMVGCYILEHVMRDNFLNSRMLSEIARRDPLTELFNRRAFQENYLRIWRQAARDRVPLAVILADVDYFKKYNDLYGHLDGDECLKKVAAVLSEAVKRPFDIVARYGGEEFVILCFDVKKDFVSSLAEKIRQGVYQLNLEHDGSEIDNRLTITLGGVIAIPESNSSPNDCINLADSALYQAKAAGRNRIALGEANYNTNTSVVTINLFEGDKPALAGRENSQFAKQQNKSSSHASRENSFQ